MVLCKLILLFRDTIRSLWRSVSPGGLLVFAEIGSPVGFQMVKYIRDILIKEDTPATIIAPCPHQFSCPMGSANWCHMKQRVFLLQHERTATTKPYRDVPFTYIVAQKPNVLGLGMYFVLEKSYFDLITYFFYRW